MRLLVLSSWWPAPPTNGSKLRAWHLLRELARRHEVSLCSFAEDGEAQPDQIASLRGWCREVHVVPGNPHKPRQALSWRGYFGAMPRSYAQTYAPEMAARVARGRDDAEAIVALQVGTAVYLSSTNGRGRTPCLFDEAEASVIRDARPGWRQQLTWRKYAAFTKRLIETASRTTVVSEEERRCLRDAGCDASRIALLPNGVDGDYLARTDAKRQDTLIYAGSLTYAPNLEAVSWFAAEILPRIHAVRPRATLLVTGRCDGVPIGTINTLTSRGVVLTGFVSDVASQVAGCAVSIAPLRTGGGTRLKILEAMALGTPVVSTSKGAEGLDMRHDEHLLIADDPRTFARHTLDLLQQPERVRALVVNARRCIAERYTWHRIGQQLEDVLQDAVAAERGGRRS